MSRISHSEVARVPAKGIPPSAPPPPWTFADLFSGAGGMSLGFHAHPEFELVGAVDAQVGKPSGGRGTLGCNATYARNLGVVPFEADLRELDGPGLRGLLEPALLARELDVLSACPPCTGFSRANPNNHLADDPRNSLVARVALWVEALRPRILVMENARELLMGRFAHHYEHLERRLHALGYATRAEVHRLDRFGLPQKRERALVVAATGGLEPRSLEDLWEGWEIAERATHVRRAIGRLPRVGAGEAPAPRRSHSRSRARASDPHHVAPGFAPGASPGSATNAALERLRLVPHDGGSWADLRDHPRAREVLTPGMLRRVARGDFGSHPDVYGRMRWDAPAPTIKRECAHTGNGRYAHPEQDRLCTLREMAILQGFPRTFRFGGGSLSNHYRQIGDAVPPLISHQLAWIASWMLGGARPTPETCLLAGTHLRPSDVRRASGAKDGRPPGPGAAVRG